MFEQLIANNPNHQQQNFSIISFVNKAIQLTGHHTSIINSVNYLNTYHPQFDIGRAELNAIWTNLEIPIYTKILITFWWGNMSHKDQAPLFYNDNNLSKILNFSEKFMVELTQINNQQIEFETALKSLYNSLKFKDGCYKMDGINTAFFTKLLQFGITNPIQPIIADKWSIRAILADMINQGYGYNSIFRIGLTNGKISVNFRGSEKNEFEKYLEMIQYFNLRCTTLQINPLELEEIMFGVGNAMHVQNNPRLIAQNIILQIL